MQPRILDIWRIRITSQLVVFRTLRFYVEFILLAPNNVWSDLDDENVILLNSAWHAPIAQNAASSVPEIVPLTRNPRHLYPIAWFRIVYCLASFGLKPKHSLQTAYLHHRYASS
jgi:hypothetical protein